jgi:serine/threonine protein phosphatase PrpC
LKEKLDLKEKNALKEDSKFFISKNDLVTELNKESTAPLKLTMDDDETIGMRPNMQDAHGFAEINTTSLQGELLYVFDGHGYKGEQVATKAKQEIASKLQKIGNEEGVDIKGALSALVANLHQSMKGIEGGATAVICFVDKETNIAHVATVGDAEAVIHREIEIEGKKEYKVIPLSRVVDWGNATLEKGQEIYNRDNLKVTTERDKYNPKDLSPVAGHNFARSVGDHHVKGLEHEMEYTCFSLQPGDHLFLGCDGFVDGIRHGECIDMIKENKPFIARQIVEKALKRQKEEPLVRDNVTVMHVHVSGVK